ncbi:CatB-related O-acetyltransferase [Ursidibacter arcticus]
MNRTEQNRTEQNRTEQNRTEYLNFVNVKSVLHQNYDIFLPDYQIVTSPLSIEPPAELIAGVDTYDKNVAKIGAFSYSWSRITPNVQSIGRYCSIAGNVTFGTMEHPLNLLSTSSFTYEDEWMWGNFAKRQNKIYKCHLQHQLPKLINIGNDVWIGLNVYIKNGISLGNGCVVGANSVVTRNVPPYAIVAGNPAKIIRYRFSDKIIADLENLKWWEYSFLDFSHLDISNIEQFILDLQELIQEDQISKYNPKRIILK